MSNFTPGPWTMETVRTSSGVCFKVGPFPWKDGKLNHACIYADYPGNGPHVKELVANAQLIAASPILLTALIAAQAYVPPSSPVHQQVVAAIAQATGVQT